MKEIIEYRGKKYKPIDGDIDIGDLFYFPFTSKVDTYEDADYGIFDPREMGAIKVKKIKSESKQVIVMRKDLGMRKGKMISQGAHASLGGMLKLMKKSEFKYEIEFDKDSHIDRWLNGAFTKITVGVNSEEELIKLYKEAKESNIPSIMITDAGKTEFGGVPTKTCICIGPYYSEEIDKITGNLGLL